MTQKSDGEINAAEEQSEEIQKAIVYARMVLNPLLTLEQCFKTLQISSSFRGEKQTVDLRFVGFRGEDFGHIWFHQETWNEACKQAITSQKEKMVYLVAEGQKEKYADIDAIKVINVPYQLSRGFQNLLEAIKAFEQSYLGLYAKTIICGKKSS